MAKSHQIAEVPRFLLPRLTWTAQTPRINTPSQASNISPFTSRRALSSSGSLTSWRGYTSGASTYDLHSRLATATLSVSQPPPQSKQRQGAMISRTSQISTSTSLGPPIRHNGPYATSFPRARRAFSSSRQLQKDHHFDTLKFVTRLRAEGFSEAQSAALMRVLSDVIEESIQNLTRTMVLREDAERSTYTQKVDFAKLRSELMNSDSTEAQLTRSSHERLTSDVAKLNSRLRDEIGRTMASVRLDLNLEKGRIREESNAQEMRIKETETRIEQEVAGLRERVESVKFSTLQWLM